MFTPRVIAAARTLCRRSPSSASMCRRGMAAAAAAASNVDVNATFQSFASQTTVQDILQQKGNIHNLCSVSDVVVASQAVKHMAVGNVGSVAVCISRQVVGIFTERDYMKKIGAVEEAQSETVVVRDVMTSNVVVVTPEMSLFDCAAYMMGPISFRHLPVVTDLKYKYLVDVISVKDVLAAIVRLISSKADISPQAAKYNHIAGAVTAGDLMSIHHREPQLVQVSKNAMVYEALQTMAVENVGSTAVMDGQEFVGIFTERDFLKKCLVMNRRSHNTKVHEVMTPAPTTVLTTDTITDCLRHFVTGGFRHLPVSDASSGAVLGMISIQDVLRVLMTAE